MEHIIETIKNAVKDNDEFDTIVLNDRDKYLYFGDMVNDIIINKKKYEILKNRYAPEGTILFMDSEKINPFIK